jgi:hypothetical protein
MVAFTSLFQKVPGERMAKGVAGHQMAHLVEPQKPSKPLPIGGHRATGRSALVEAPPCSAESGHPAAQPPD